MKKSNKTVLLRTAKRLLKKNCKKLREMFAGFRRIYILKWLTLVGILQTLTKLSALLAINWEFVKLILPNGLKFILQQLSLNNNYLR